MEGQSLFSMLDDPRRGNALRYPLDEILLVAMATMLTGGSTCVDMDDFGRQNLAELRTLLPFEHGTPRHDTFSRVFQLLDPDRFGLWFTQFWQAFLARVPAHIAIDGKTLRRTLDAAEGRRPLHMINACATPHGLVLAQRPVPADGNEIDAVRATLDLLDLTEATVTADAMHCQRETARQILDQGGHCMLAVKGNQASLHEDLANFWGADPAGHPSCTSQRVTDSGHGRIETRTAYVSTDVGWIQAHHDWPGLAAVVKIRAVRECKNGKLRRPAAEQTRHYVVSRPLSASDANTLARWHWHVENHVHWVLDVVFHEDQSRNRKDNGPSNLALVRKMALNILRNDPDKVSIKRKQRRAMNDFGYLLQLLESVG